MSDPTSTSDSSWIYLEVMECMLADHASSGLASLQQYLDSYPGFEVAVASAWLQINQPVDPEATESDIRTHATTTPVALGDPGSRIAQYELLHELGAGGQARVFLAKDRSLGRQVALKILPPAFVHQDAAKRLEREAALTSRLDHPGIGVVYGTGTHEGWTWIAMRYVEGPTLGELIRSWKTPEDPSDSDEAERTVAEARSASSERDRIQLVLQLTEKVARALHAAHEAGVIHRDVKPSNILVGLGSEPTLVDFGLAGEADRQGTKLTRTGDIFGTPAWMSPEQVCGDRIDRRSDVWSLGVVLYECLTFHKPFQAPTRKLLHHEILTQRPQPAQRHNALLPKDLEDVLEVALAKSVDDRYQSAKDLADDLRALRERRPIAARPPGAIQRTVQWARQSKAKAALIAVLVLGIPLVAGLGGFLIAGWDDLEQAKAERILRDREALLAKGFLQLFRNNAQKARLSLQQILSEEPKYHAASIGMAIYHLDSGGPAAATQWLEEHPEGRHPLLESHIALTAANSAEYLPIPKAPPSNAFQAFVEGMLLLRDLTRMEQNGANLPRSAFADVRERLAMAVALAPRARPVYHYFWALSAGKTRHEVQLASSTRAIEANWGETSLDAWLVIGRASQLCAPNRGLRAFEEVLARDPSHLQARLFRADTLYAMGKLPEAKGVYFELCNDHPEVENAWWGLGLCYAKLADGNREQLKLALAAYEGAVEAAPQSPRARLDLARAHWALEHFEDGLRIAAEACELDPSYAAAPVVLGLLLAERGQTQEAEAAFRRAIQRQRHDPWAHEVLAAHLKEQGHDKDWIAELRRWVQVCEGRGPGIEAHLQLAEALMERSPASKEEIRSLATQIAALLAAEATQPTELRMRLASIESGLR